MLNLNLSSFFSNPSAQNFLVLLLICLICLNARFHAFIGIQIGLFLGLIFFRIRLYIFYGLMFFIQLISYLQFYLVKFSIILFFPGLLKDL